MAAATKLNGFDITSIQDALVDRELLDLLSASYAADTDRVDLPIRVIASLAAGHAEPNSPEFSERKADADRMRSEHLRPNYIKLFDDGGTMA